MNVVFDTNILLSASLWDQSSARKLLTKLVENNINIYSSVEIIQEYFDVMSRDFKFSREDAEETKKEVFSTLIIVEPKIKFDVVKEDPEDNIVLECAVECNADYLITYDNHLLKIKEF